MKIFPYGAVGGEVTGSAYHVQTARANVLVDFGMFQGVPHAEHRNRVPDKLEVPRLDAVLLTHAHLDHCGRLPLLPMAGFRGPIICTPATIELTSLILYDSAKVQAQDLDRVNRKRQRAGQEPVAPLYTSAEVDRLMTQFKPAPYQQPVEVAPGVRARFFEAGHILGSASIELLVEENGANKVVLFSGDLGPKGAPILRDAACVRDRTDAVFLEATYGNHDHKPFNDTVAEFESILRQAIAQKGKILVPTFAVGRAQLLMLLLASMFRHQRLPEFPIFLDSPMAIEATRIYQRHRELFDEEMLAFLREGPIEQDLFTVKASPTAEDSKKINDVPGPCLVLAGAGMCNAGRILHHLRQNLWRPEAHVLMVGFQAEGTLGRLLVNGQKEVHIFGETVVVKARIHTLGGFSAHAGQTDLLAWFACLADHRPAVYLTHGEDDARGVLAVAIRQKHGLEAQLPKAGDRIEL